MVSSLCTQLSVSSVLFVEYLIQPNVFDAFSELYDFPLSYSPRFISHYFFFVFVFADLSVEFGSLTQEGLVPITAVIRKM